jgi:capsular exopolysaccharide synthesis family protein
MSDNGNGDGTEPTFRGTNQREQSFKELLAIVRRRKWTGLIVALLVLAGGTWKTMHDPRIYAAVVTVRVTQQMESPVQGAPVAQPEYDYRVDPLVSEQQVIRSKLIAARAASEAGLRLQVSAPANELLSNLVGENRPVVTDTMPDGLYRLLASPVGYALAGAARTYGPVAYGKPIVANGFSMVVPGRPPERDKDITLAVKSLDEVAQNLQYAIQTRVLPQTDIIEITVFGNDPPRTRDAANAVAKVYGDYSREQAQIAAAARSKFIERSLDEQAMQLAHAEDSLRVFQESHQTTDVGAEVQAILTSIYDLESKKQDLLLEQRVYLALVGSLEATDTSDADLQKLIGTDAVANNRAVADLYGRWYDLLKTRQTMALTLNDRNRDMQAMDSTINGVKSQLTQASGLYLESVASRIASVDSSIADLRRQTQRFPPLSAAQARYEDNVKTMEEGYENLISQYQLSRIGESAETGRVRVIDAAETPGIPVSPHRKRAVLISALLGLVAAIVAAMLADRFDDAVQNPDEVRDRLNLTVLGSIPRVRRSEAGQPEETREKAFRMVTHIEPQSLVAEAFRSLRTNVAFARAHQDLRTLMITSPAPGEGKSTVAVNLATTFAQQGQRTLLIDADLRRSVLDETFNIPRSPGLTNVLVGSDPLEAVVRTTDVPNLSILPSGQFPPNPSELLGSAQMRALIDLAKQSFDIVLVDSPPVLAVTDAAVLSTVADGSVIVIRLGVTTREAVRRSVSQLRVVNGRILGAVLNAVDFRGPSYQGGYGYYYERFYGHGPGPGRTRTRRLADALRGVRRNK